MPVKTKTELIMIIRLVKGTSTERRYPPQIRVNMASKTLAHYISPYKWNNHGSTRKQTRTDEHPESKTVYRKSR
jgi:hypothetical protein